MFPDLTINSETKVKFFKGTKFWNYVCLNAKYAFPLVERQILHEDIISLVGFWEKIGITYQSFKDFFDQLKQILQNTIVKVKVSKLADGFGEQDIIYEQ